MTKDACKYCNVIAKRIKVIVYIIIVIIILLYGKGARFSGNDRALLTRCPRHIQFVSGHPCYGQLTAVKKGYPLTSVT